MENRASARHISTAPKRRRRRRLRYGRIAAALLILAAVLFLLIKGTVFIVQKLTNKEQETTFHLAGETVSDLPEDFIKTQKPAIPSFQKTNSTKAFGDAIECGYGILTDLQEGTVLYEKDAYSRIYPASLTKIMTLIVAVEQCEDLSDTFTMTNDIIDPLFEANASRAGFKHREQVSIRDLLYGTILPSGADAAVALALYVSGSEEAFAALMNEKVKELGLLGTHFTNATGLHDRDQYSTAYDLAVILAYALSNDTCREVLSAQTYTTAATQQNPDGIELQSTLFSYMYGDEPEGALVLGGKNRLYQPGGSLSGHLCRKKRKKVHYDSGRRRYQMETGV